MERKSLELQTGACIPPDAARGTKRSTQTPIMPPPPPPLFILTTTTTVFRGRSSEISSPSPSLPLSQPQLCWCNVATHVTLHGGVPCDPEHSFLGGGGRAVLRYGWCAKLGMAKGPFAIERVGVPALMGARARTPKRRYRGPRPKYRDISPTSPISAISSLPGASNM